MWNQPAFHAALVTLYLLSLGTLLAKIFVRLTPRGGLVDYWLRRRRLSQELRRALEERARRARRGEE